MNAVFEVPSIAPRFSDWPLVSSLPGRSPEDEAASLASLKRRMGDAHFGARLRAQVDMMVQLTGNGRGGFHFENVPAIARAVKLGLRVSGLERRGRRHALALRCEEREMVVPRLPRSFDGLRVLHLSDLHLDAMPGFGARVAAALATASFDLCVVTGDFRYLDTGRYAHVEAEMRALAPALRCELGTYGVLGNHDFAEMVPVLESCGVRMLVNEAEPIRMRDERLWIVGLDDPHLYGLHDFERALKHVPDGEAKLLLVHSPEVIDQAVERGFGAYFTGHTHGGQICAPGGRILYLHARCDASRASGSWRAGAMAGYTSRGVGASSVFARFNCPPEIVVHELRAA